MTPERIWLPELTLMNGAEDMAQDFHRIRVLVNKVKFSVFIWKI